MSADGGGAPEPAELDDSALVRACLNGDERAWEALVERYGRLVASIPRGMGLSAADAEDVFQHVFVQLLGHLARLRDRDRLSSWLITTARRESWRVAKQAGRDAALAEAVAAAGAPAEETVRFEREAAVRAAMTRLDERCRLLLTALFLDPTPARYAALARTLGVPIGSIGPTRARCFRKLEAILAESGFDAE